MSFWTGRGEAPAGCQQALGMDQEAVGSRVIGGVNCDIDWNMRIDFTALEQDVIGEANVETSISN